MTARSPSCRAALRGLAVFLALLGWGTAAQSLETGERAPAFRMPSLSSGSEISLDASRGRVIYLDFWASWCAPCATSLPLLDALQEELGPQGFTVLAVNVDRDPEKARRFLERHPVRYPSASDPEGRLPALYGVPTMPTSYLIDRKGTVRLVHRGFRRSDLETLRREIHALLAEGR